MTRLKRKLLALLTGATGFLCSRAVARYGPLYDRRLQARLEAEELGLLMPFASERLRQERKNV